jgi:peptidoglycan hydrolase-like protein with peptidoglycan-binding domain
VIVLQALLEDAGFPPARSKTKKGTWDGKFGPETANSVRKVQEDAGLLVDGKVGRQTWCALGIR